jgi:hypothetical protein
MDGRSRERGAAERDVPNVVAQAATTGLVIDAVRELLWTTGKALSPRLRSTVVTRLFGMSGKDSASALGIELRTLQGYVVQARDRLGLASLDEVGGELMLRLGGEVRPMLEAWLDDATAIDVIAQRFAHRENSARRTRR